ncbi:MAG TPA: hypothetical protein VLI55_19145 [Bryobacteraceae bacterium]|nr:hypothetical protein [Bryobacteraceae bacterium]
MHFDTALNLLWVALGVLALAGAIRTRLRQPSAGNRAPAWLHIAGVALIVAALFPYISATDDVLRIQHLNAQQDHQHPDKKHSNDNLIRLYETMDTPLISSAVVLVFATFFISLVITPSCTLIDRSEPFESGRSPPFVTA